MPELDALDIDSLREKFPRAYKALVQLYPFEWDKMLRIADEAMQQGKTASVVAGKFSILRGLEKSTRRWVVLCFAADRREIVMRQQRSFLTPLFDRSLDDILAELRDIEQRNLPAGATPTPPNDRLPRGYVFISHESTTQGVLALHLAESLEAGGTSCWVAPRNVRAGSNWNEQVYGAAQRCSALVLLCSEHSAKSKIVQGEVHIVVGRGVPVIVVKLGDIDPALINVGLAAYHHLDWRARDTNDIASLAEQLRGALALTPEP